MTDPTPQAEQRVCKWCLRTIVPPTNEMPYWSERIRFLGWHCLSQEGPGKHEPAEPSPAPQAEREWLVVDSMPEAMKILADKLKQDESALTTMREERDIRHTAIQQPFTDKIQEMSKELTALREERDRYKESFNVECDRREGCLDQLTTMREERDRSDDDATSMGKMLGDARKGLRDMTEERDRAQAALRVVEDILRTIIHETSTMDHPAWQSANRYFLALKGATK